MKAMLSSIFYFPEDTDSFCNMSLTPILARLRAIESTGSFIRRFMTAHQTTGTDLKRYNRFQAPDWPSGTECPLSSQSSLDQPWAEEAGNLIRIRALWSEKWSFVIVASRTPSLWQLSTFLQSTIRNHQEPDGWCHGKDTGCVVRWSITLRSQHPGHVRSCPRTSTSWSVKCDESEVLL